MILVSLRHLFSPSSLLSIFSSLHLLLSSFYLFTIFYSLHLIFSSSSLLPIYLLSLSLLSISLLSIFSFLNLQSFICLFPIPLYLLLFLFSLLPLLFNPHLLLSPPSPLSIFFSADPPISLSSVLTTFSFYRLFVPSSFHLCLYLSLSASPHSLLPSLFLPLSHSIRLSLSSSLSPPLPPYQATGTV